MDANIRKALGRLRRSGYGFRGTCFICKQSRVLFTFRFHPGIKWGGYAATCCGCIAEALNANEGALL